MQGVFGPCGGVDGNGDDVKDVPFSKTPDRPRPQVLFLLQEGRSVGSSRYAAGSISKEATIGEKKVF